MVPAEAFILFLPPPTCTLMFEQASTRLFAPIPPSREPQIKFELIPEEEQLRLTYYGLDHWDLPLGIPKVASRPLEPIHLTDFRLPLGLPQMSWPSHRNPQAIKSIIQTLAPSRNYLPTSDEVFCNVLVADCCKLMGVGYPVDKRGYPMVCNQLNLFLHAEGPSAGFHQCSARQAQHYANQGHFCFALWPNPDFFRHGHIAIVRPGQLSATQGPTIAQAGRRCFSQGYFQEGFGKKPATFWVHA